MVYLPTWKPYKSTKCWGTIPYMDPMGTDLSFKCHTVWVPYSMWILDPKLMLSQIVDSICVFFVMKRPRLTLAYLWIFAFRLGCTRMHQKTLLVIGNIHNFWYRNYQSTFPGWQFSRHVCLSAPVISTTKLGILAHLRMVSWNLNTMSFVSVIGHPNHLRRWLDS